MSAFQGLLRLEDQVAIVTGGSRGIGKAVVELFAQLGAHAVVNYVSDAAAAEAVVETVKGQGRQAIAFKADVSKSAEAHRLIQATLEQFKRIDILVCSAGIWEGDAIESMTDEMWDKTIDVNLKGTWSVCKAVAPAMKQREGGKIVVVSSTAGQRGEAGYSNYAASKGGQIAFVKSLAVELAPWKINVNAVAPGWVDTDMTKEALGNSESRAAIASNIPIGAVATAEDIARPIAFLCSDWARHITGEVLNVNGGSVLCG
ncbi:MAG TPA: SDR family NAD(P)-dependent oxidoreductase [Pyrinomonadaceae bacterium]|nr:SDR family NAD(P)-dependent oxidoreductase [Pyrinomonadaceae bacterium]